MKPEILVFTAFTETSRNALQYACAMAKDRDYSLVLTHTYDPPLNYAADALAFSSIHLSMEHTEEKLKAEADWAREQYPGLQIAAKLTFGNPVDCLNELLGEYHIDFLIVGAPQSQGEFWGWNDVFVDIINQLPIPVLIIPRSVTYQGITHIGFASDYANPLQQQQLDFIKRVLDAGPAQLHIIHVSVPDKRNDQKRQEHRNILEQRLRDYSPVYASIENTDVVATIIRYIRAHDIQLLIVIPHRHGIWYSIFNQRHSRRLTRINHLPILALHD
ncbi:universal stress protein [Taibaiella koreensis]|uniref:universal stress protein n=1 Tax=Taibaiella koreensis TaxID=1268548 RepID=UPI000E59F2BF|nr:universal stress protein [Taibaiella koreensis]